MKIVLIIVGILLCLTAIYGFMVYKTQNGIEEYPLKVIKKYDHIEIRSYEASLFTSVTIPKGTYKETSSRGFRILAGYIFGDNEEQEKIAMTSPVMMSMEDSTTMMFMVPKQYKKEELPSPNQTSISFEELPPKTMAAISFGGWADDEKIEEYKKKLIAQLEFLGISFSNNFYFLGYNAPYELINRKNEVVVELINAQL